MESQNHRVSDGQVENIIPPKTPFCGGIHIISTGIPGVTIIFCFSRVVATGNTSFVQFNIRPVVKGKFLKPSNLKTNMFE